MCRVRLIDGDLIRTHIDNLGEIVPDKRYKIRIRRQAFLCWNDDYFAILSMPMGFIGGMGAVCEVWKDGKKSIELVKRKERIPFQEEELEYYIEKMQRMFGKNTQWAWLETYQKPEEIASGLGW